MSVTDSPSTTQIAVGFAVGSSIVLGGLLASQAAADFTLVPMPPIVFGGGHFPTMTAAGDLNGSGLPDLISPGRDPKGLVHVLTNLGGGEVEIVQTLQVGGHTDWATLGDLDGDGDLDLMLALRSGVRGVTIRNGIGDGTFTTTGQHLVEGRDLRCAEFVDLNGNGHLDAVAVDYTGAVMRIYRNDGSGVLLVDPPIRLVPHVGGQVSAGQLVVTDLDGDGHPDIVVTSTGAGRVSLFRNRGDGTFETALNRRPSGPISGIQPGLINTVAVDMNGDGSIDLVTPLLTGFGLQYIAVQPNDGDGGFGESIVSVGVLNSASYFGAAADLDGDGKPDLAVGHALSGVIGLSRNLDGTTLASPQILNVGTFVRHILPVDMDGDGIVDLVAVDAPEHTMHILLNQTPQAVGGIAAAEAPAAPSAAPPSAPPGGGRPREPRIRAGVPELSDGASIGLWLQERER